MGKLQKNTNLVYDALETARLEESVNKPNENDGIMTVRIKTIKQFDNVVQDLRDVKGAVGDFRNNLVGGVGMTLDETGAKFKRGNVVGAGATLVGDPVGWTGNDVV